MRAWCHRLRASLRLRWRHLVCRYRGHDYDSRYIAPAFGNRLMFPKAKLQVRVCVRCGHIDYAEAEMRCGAWFMQHGVYFMTPLFSEASVRNAL